MLSKILKKLFKTQEEKEYTQEQIEIHRHLQKLRKKKEKIDEDSRKVHGSVDVDKSK